MRRRALRGGLVAALLLASPIAAHAQSSGDVRVSRPDRWFVASSVDGATNETTRRMLYLGRDGTMLIVQCAARDGRKTGGWAVTLRRDDWAFPTDFVDGWWSVDSEPVNGPLRWGGSGPMVILNEEALRDRLKEPVEEHVTFRVSRGDREWSVALRARGLETAVETFAPSCEVA
ncbi:MAG TPA: hypothetical protein VLA09_00950 [Longimicrobiales bacterium]|nr:hypothetical protein [Longimicrobiales bacterium]